MPHLLAYIAIVAVCVAASATDLRTGRIPNKLTASAMVAGLLFWLIAGLVTGRGLVGAEDAISGTISASFLGLLCGLIPFAILVMMGGLGGGDMKLMGALGAWSAHWRIVLDTTVYALLVGALIAIVLMVRHGRVKLTLVRLFGIAASRGKVVSPDDDAGMPKVPFAVAVLAGIALAGAEHMLWFWPWPPLLG